MAASSESEDPVRDCIFIAFEQLGLTFRPNEEQIIAVKAFVTVEQNSTFVTLPTGYGKSFIFLCLPKVFQLLAIGREKVTDRTCRSVSSLSSE